MKLLGTYLDKLDAIPREFILNILADEYDNTKTYAVNDACIHDTHIYRCITAIETAEEWTPAHWEAVTMFNQLSDRISSAITALTSLMNNTFLKLSGGTMTGPLNIKTGDNVGINSDSDSSFVRINGGKSNASGSLWLSGKSRTGYEGYFGLVAHNGTTQKALEGKPDGTLTWNNEWVVTSDQIAVTADTTTFSSACSVLAYYEKIASNYYKVTVQLYIPNTNVLNAATTSGNWYKIATLGAHKPLLDTTKAHFGSLYAHVTDFKVCANGECYVYYNVGQSAGQGPGWSQGVITYMTHK